MDAGTYPGMRLADGHWRTDSDAGDRASDGTMSWPRSDPANDFHALRPLSGTPQLEGGLPGAGPCWHGMHSSSHDTEADSSGSSGSAASSALEIIA